MKFSGFGAVVARTSTSTSPELQEIVQNIRAGYRVMVILRGASGSGKTKLAQQIIDDSGIGRFADHVFGADTFFYDSKREQYKFDPKYLEMAHTINRSKAKQHALAGWSPIIVDNTNIRVWEMVPYVQMGVENGYLISILDGMAPWAKDVNELIARNTKGVPDDTLHRMVNKYEYTTVEKLMRLNNLAYNVTLPMMRNLPPIDT